jgi:hypothetical protein
MGWIIEPSDQFNTEAIKEIGNRYISRAKTKSTESAPVDS